MQCPNVTGNSSMSIHSVRLDIQDCTQKALNEITSLLQQHFLTNSKVLLYQEEISIGSISRSTGNITMKCVSVNYLTAFILNNIQNSPSLKLQPLHLSSQWLICVPMNGTLLPLVQTDRGSTIKLQCSICHHSFVFNLHVQSSNKYTKLPLLLLVLYQYPITWIKRVNNKSNHYENYNSVFYIVSNKSYQQA